MSSMSSLLGSTPASVSASAFRMTMNCIVVSSSVGNRLVVPIAPGLLAAPVVLGDEVLIEIGEAVHLAHLDLLTFRHRDLACPGQRLGQVLDLNHPEPGDQLLGFGKWAVDHPRLAAGEELHFRALAAAGQPLH